MIDQARKKLVTDIFKLKGNVYAFDSTTIPLYLSVLWWAKFRKKNGGVRAYVLYDLESQVPAFFHISNLIDNHSLLPCCYQGNMICKRSTYEVLQILSISLRIRHHSLISSKGLISIMSKNSIVPSFRDYLINV